MLKCFTLVQFPIKLAHAITAYKIQGQTIPKPLKVAFDIDSIFEEAQGYVMLSRVQELKQIFILMGEPGKRYLLIRISQKGGSDTP
jgi:hypothetical protein